jgi:competence protein ComGC
MTGGQNECARFWNLVGVNYAKTQIQATYTDHDKSDAEVKNLVAKGFLDELRGYISH